MNQILTKTNFTAGELSPDMMGRGDLEFYANGARELTNVVIAPTGGVSRRPGLRYVDKARGAGRLLAFEFNTEQTYLLVFSHLKADIYAGEVHVASLDTPWTQAQLSQIHWTQSADTLLVAHADVESQRITRTSHSQWTITPWRYYEKDGLLHIPYHKFAGDTVTLAASGNSGTVTLTASADVFSSAHLGLRLRLRECQMVVSEYLSPTQVRAEVKKSGFETQASTDWDEQAFSSLRGWPASVCFHQDRLVIGGAKGAPNRLWLSKTSDLFNFDLGTALDDEAIEFALLSDQVNAIRAVFSGRHLQVFTSGAEWMVSGEPLTPTKIQITRQTRQGMPVDRLVPPRHVDGATLYVSRNGKSLCEFLFADVEQAYQSVDLAVLSKHMLIDPVDQDYDPTRRLFHLVNGDGSMAVVAVYRAQKVTGWSRFITDGAFRSVAQVDQLTFVLVERDGQFFIERFDPSLFLDCALDGLLDTPSRTWSGLDHLDGKNVQILADGGVLAQKTVAGGTIELDDVARLLQVGLSFTHVIQPLPPVAAGMTGVASASHVRLIKAIFRLQDTAALHLDTGRGVQPVPFGRFDRARFDRAPQAFSGDVQVRAIGWKQDPHASLWAIRQMTPLPCTVLAVATELKLSE